MVKHSRLPAEERRQSILLAAVPLFAEFGFKGTTTRMIAASAHVSEALLYKHFPSKDAIYSELQELCCADKKEVSEKVKALEPSTSTLIYLIYYLISTIFQGDRGEDETGFQHRDLQRLMANSFLEDGVFATVFLDHNIAVWEPILMRSIEAAIASGDMIEDWLHPSARWWLGHHLAVACGLLNLPAETVIPYSFPIEDLLNHAVRFALRGMGLTDKAIATHYNPGVLALFKQNLHRQSSQ